MGGTQGVGRLQPSSYQFMQTKGIDTKDGVSRGELKKLDANADGNLNAAELSGINPKDRSAVQTAFVQHGSAASEVVFPALSEHAEAHEEHQVGVGGVLGTHGVVAAAEHGTHHAIEHVVGHTATRVGEEAVARTAEHTVGRATEHVIAHAATRAAEHATGEVVAHGAAHFGARMASVAAPGVGAAAAGYLAYKSIDHAIDAGKKGNVGASLSYSLAGVVDATTAVVNAAGAVSGAGVVISTPVSLALGAVATGFAALGAYLDD